MREYHYLAYISSALSKEARKKIKDAIEISILIGLIGGTRSITRRMGIIHLKVITGKYSED
jgi:translation initiation factor 6 (eIF-6)